MLSPKISKLKRLLKTQGYDVTNFEEKIKIAQRPLLYQMLKLCYSVIPEEQDELKQNCEILNICQINY
jgi:hypothetical protein